MRQYSQKLIAQISKHITKSISDNYTAFKTRKEVKDDMSDLYKFSSWLMRNKNHLSYLSIRSNAEGINNLTTARILIVWDNLIYQTLNKESVYVREALIQLLIANQFLLAFKEFSTGLNDDVVFTEDQEKEFIRRANASVVINKDLFDKPTTQIKKKAVSKEQERRLKNTTKLVSAVYMVKEYESLLKRA